MNQRGEARSAGSETAPSIDCAQRSEAPFIDPAAVIDHPSGYLALSGKNRRFQQPGLQGFIAYREQGRHWFALGGVHGAPAARGPLLDAFVERAAEQRRRVAAVQVRTGQVELFRQRGFVVNQLGQSYGLELQGFRLSGTARMKLRNKIGRARKLGLRVVELGQGLPRDAERFRQLEAVSAAWLRDKGKKELDFMIGEIGGPAERARRIFCAVDAAGAMQGFITYVPAWGERPGYLHDLTRRLPDAPPGAMELVNVEAMQVLRDEGAPYLHFGFTPFLLPPEAAPGAGASPALHWLIRQLSVHGQAIYPAASQVDYKLKWGPDVIEPEYVACKPLSARAVWDLLVLTRSI